MIITVRTDKQEAEIGLFSVEGQKLVYKTWQAHRELSSTILVVINKLLGQQNMDFTDVTGIVFYSGPGSFTGLRIGASVANALQKKSVNAKGDDWIKRGIERLQKGVSEPALPQYGEEAHTTPPKK